MARPIRETPILYGKDAERFVEEMKRVESLTPEQRKANREKLYIARKAERCSFRSRACTSLSRKCRHDTSRG